MIIQFEKKTHKSYNLLINRIFLKQKIKKNIMIYGILLFNYKSLEYLL